jgi:hypothetical protein
MTTNRCVHLWFTLSVFCLIASPTAGATIDIVATADATSNMSGFLETTPLLQINGIGPVPTAFSSAVIEFSLAGLSGATVESATFLGTLISSSSLTPPAMLLLFGYTGNGVVGRSDFFRPRIPVGTSGALPNVAPPQTSAVAVPLDISFVQGLLGGHLGLFGSASAISFLQLASLESTLGVTPPTLRLVTSETLPPTPLAEPATVLLVASGLAAVARVRCRMKARRAS